MTDQPDPVPWLRTYSRWLSSCAEYAAADRCTAAADELERLRQERDSACRERDELRETVAFFASVIKSGESWSEQCEQRMALARRAREGL